ncbi:type I restriction endonuclease [Flavobacterium sp. SUN052]|nr:type I restriction endonuclease [Flavobacterium sp. SUN052]MEC4004890.1 type I restriction endonuclease [Flavobacterium sp. SUN052]
MKEQIQTEEATKNAFMMQFLQSLGYNVFNTLEVVPENITDIDTKRQKI